LTALQRHTDELMTSPSNPRRTPALVVATTLGVLLGVGSVTGVGLAAGTGRLAGESDDSKALKVLRADQAALVRLTREVSADQRLADLHDSAQVAERLAEQTRERDTALVILGDARVRADALRAHRATLAVLSGFSDLSAVSAKSLDTWDVSERDVVNALGELDAVAAPVAALDREQPLRVDTRRVEAVVEKTSSYLTESARKLASYEKRTVKFRRKNRKKIQAAADYKATVESQMAAYQATRRDLQRYLDDTAKFGELIRDFKDALQSAKSKRQGVRATLASMAVPNPIQGEQQRLIAVLDHAIAATDVGVDLADATQSLRDAGDYGTSGFDLPEYRDFASQSDAITSERDSAMSAWTAATAAYTKRLKNPKGAPKRPVI
jgi:hypothetical protein